MQLVHSADAKNLSKIMLLRKGCRSINFLAVVVNLPYRPNEFGGAYKPMLHITSPHAPSHSRIS